MLYTLITGASKGIGKALAEECASRKWNVFLVARSEELLKKLAADLIDKHGIDAKYKTVDLERTEDIDGLFNYLKQEDILIDKCINNAGFGDLSVFNEADITKQARMIRLNVEALTVVTHYFINQLPETTKGYLLSVASTASFNATPYMSVYGGTKAFVLSFSQGLRYEYRKRKLNISCLCPGATDTEFTTHANSEHLAEAYKSLFMSSKAVAEIGINGLMRNKAVNIPGMINKLGALSGTLLPDALVVPQAGKIFDPSKA